MPFRVIRQDLIRVKADAIVNTANPKPVYGRGTDEAVYLAAGAEKLLAERRKIGEMVPGQAAVTPAFDLPAKYIIHTVGPRWTDGSLGEEETLRQCYRSSLKLAESLSCESVAFPLISTGSYHFPVDLGMQIALSEIQAYLMNSEMTVLLVVYSELAYELSERLFAGVESFIDRNYIREAEEKRSDRPRLSGMSSRRRRENRNSEEESSFSLYEPSCAPERLDETMIGAPDMARLEMPCESAVFDDRPLPRASAAPKAKKTFMAPAPKKRKLEELVSQVGETFQERLFRLIEEKGMKNSEVYKGANMGKQHFSKLKNNVDYQPKKQTVMALAIALRLNMDETIDLLARAGYAFSPSSRQDLVVRYFIENEKYDIFTLEVALDSFGLPTLCNYG